MLAACDGEVEDEPDLVASEPDLETSEEDDSEETYEDDEEDYSEDEDDADAEDEEESDDEDDEESNDENQSTESDDSNATDHPIVGVWDDLWEDAGIAIDSQVTFNSDGTGFIENSGVMASEFTWLIEDDILTMVHPPNESWPYEVESSYRYRFDGDILIRTLLSIVDDEITEVQDFYFARVD